MKKYSEFWPEYLAAHAKFSTKVMHFLGLLLWLSFAIAGLVVGRPIFGVVTGALFGYAMAFAGHLLFEGNLPESFRHPIYSLISDFRMAWRLMKGDFSNGG